MKYIKPILIALGLQIAALFAPLLMLLALPFIRWDAAPSKDRYGRDEAVRGDLPAWLAWLGTPDERLPGGLYEPTVATMHARFGRWVCAWYWLGLRNRMHGLAARFGVPATDYWPPEVGFYEREALWWLRYPLLGGRMAFKAGYRIYKLLDGQYLAVPVFTITKA